MVETTIAFNKSDLADFNNTLKRFQKATGKAPKQVVTWGAIKLLSSLRASTKPGKQRHKVYIPKGKKEKAYRTSKGKRKFWVQTFSGRKSTPRFFAIYDYSKAAATKQARTLIHYKGVAKQSWGWAMHALFGKKINDIGDIKRAFRAVSTSKIDKPKEYGIAVTNRISYIEKAFKQNGKQAVSSALSRATSGMKKQVEKALFKAGM